MRQFENDPRRYRAELAGVFSETGSTETNYEKIVYDRWSQPPIFREIASFTLPDGNRLHITCDRDEVGSEWMHLAHLGTQQQAALAAAVNYHARFAIAAEQQRQPQKSVSA